MFHVKHCLFDLARNSTYKAKVVACPDLVPDKLSAINSAFKMFAEYFWSGYRAPCACH